MILFITGQYASAQYVHPILDKWLSKKIFKWKLVSTSVSCKYWRENKIRYKEIKKKSAGEVSKYIEKVKPNLIITSASVDVDIEHLFVIEGKKKSIPTACFIDTWVNYINRFNYKGKYIFPNLILAIDNRCKQEMIKEGIPKDIIQVVGQPYLESISKRVPSFGQNFLLAGQPINKYFGKTFGFDETDFRKIILKALKKRKISNIISSKHPEEKLKKIDSKLNILHKKGRGIIDVEESHTVFGIFSMQMIIGYLLGRNVASIQPVVSKKDPSPLSRWNLIPILKNANEVIKFIDKSNFKISKKKIEKLLKKRSEQLGIRGSITRFDKFLSIYLNKKKKIN
ncbi:hypothetical protein IDH35_02680 [Pelagibacterales bacterium SAG-MED49]|nr:hypothetical protein [Pelagibacterales bacterium SAG-MED49]